MESGILLLSGARIRSYFCSPFLSIVAVTLLSGEALAQRQYEAQRSLPPDRCPGVPAPIRKYLQLHGAQVLVSGRPDRPNVLRGQFQRAGQWDLAVLVSAPGRTEILVFWNADSWVDKVDAVSHLARRGPLNKTTSLWRDIILEPAATADLEETPPEGVPDGIEDYSYKGGGLVYFWDKGRWRGIKPTGC